MSLTATAATPATTISTPKKMAAANSFKQDIVSMGNLANYLTIAANVLVTMAVLLGWPSAETFDDSWRKNGQCYTSHEISDITTMDTNTLCCLFLCSSAAIVMAVWCLNRANMNPQLAHKLPLLAQGNVSHGLGHYFVSAIGGSIPRVRPLSLSPADLGYTLVLLAFWPTVLRSVMPRLPLGLSISIGVILVAFQGAIDIEPHLQFTFTQAVILLIQNVDLLTMSPSDKLANPWTYLISVLYYAPLFPMMWLETTQCSEWVADMGGHGIYDFYLSLASIGQAVVVPYIEPGKDQSTANKQKKAM